MLLVKRLIGNPDGMNINRRLLRWSPAYLQLLHFLFSTFISPLLATALIISRVTQVFSAIGAVDCLRVASASGELMGDPAHEARVVEKVHAQGLSYFVCFSEFVAADAALTYL